MFGRKKKNSVLILSFEGASKSECEGILKSIHKHIPNVNLVVHGYKMSYAVLDDDK